MRVLIAIAIFTVVLTQTAFAVDASFKVKVVHRNRPLAYVTVSTDQLGPSRTGVSGVATFGPSASIRPGMWVDASIQPANWVIADHYEGRFRVPENIADVEILRVLPKGDPALAKQRAQITGVLTRYDSAAHGNGKGPGALSSGQSLDQIVEQTALHLGVDSAALQNEIDAWVKLPHDNPHDRLLASIYSRDFSKALHEADEAIVDDHVSLLRVRNRLIDDYLLQARAALELQKMRTAAIAYHNITQDGLDPDNLQANVGLVTLCAQGMGHLEDDVLSGSANNEELIWCTESQAQVYAVRALGVLERVDSANASLPSRAEAIIGLEMFFIGPGLSDDTEQYENRLESIFRSIEAAADLQLGITIAETQLYLGTFQMVRDEKQSAIEHWRKGSALLPTATTRAAADMKAELLVSIANNDSDLDESITLAMQALALLKAADAKPERIAGAEYALGNINFGRRSPSLPVGQIGAEGAAAISHWNSAADLLVTAGREDEALMVRDLTIQALRAFHLDSEALTQTLLQVDLAASACKKSDELVQRQCGAVVYRVAGGLAVAYKLDHSQASRLYEMLERFIRGSRVRLSVSEKQTAKDYLAQYAKALSDDGNAAQRQKVLSFAASLN